MNSQNEPRFLYRYTNLKGDYRDWTRKILTDSVIHFASPSTFNDPFDCRVRFSQRIVHNLLWRRHADLLKERTTLTRSQRRAQAKQAVKAIDDAEFINFMTDELQGFVNKCGVLSLSANDRNILLWSHYAAGHTGVCLKFVCDEERTFFAEALRVAYSPTFPDISVTDTKQKQVDAFLLTKASDWRYEQEYRIIDHNNGSRDKGFQADLLAGVVLGARMPLEDRKEVAAWTRGRNEPVELFEAVIVDGSYSLDIRPYGG
jgi:hypothetical protein